jgi:2-polyprenyl-3-methyl-5-hydroxy-6-metoxy-1,4-benzoquinol methylase
MDILYRRLHEYQPVDIEKLRPKGSYGSLISKRNHVVDELIEKFGTIPSDLLVQRNCPTCGSDDSKPEMEKDHLSLVRCKQCALVYVSPAFNEEHYQQVYASDTYQEIVQELGEASHDYRVERFGTERVEIMSRYLSVDSKKARYLDIGCSTGFVLEAAQAAGWSATGVELNPSAAAFGQNRGLDIQNIGIEIANLEEEGFDAVSLFDVLEHLHDPQAMLKKAASYLRPGGILFLYVPNYDSASRILMGKDSHFIWPTHHLTYYTPETLTDLIDRNGMELAMLTTEGLDVFDFIWREQAVNSRESGLMQEFADKIQFFINAGCYGKNLRILARKL